MSDELSGWTIEEHIRGNKEILILHKDGEPRGTIEVDSYEEKVAWTQLVAALNLILEKP